MAIEKKEWIRTLKFTLFSISAGVIQFASFALFNSVFGIAEWISNIISLVLSVLWNFTINRKLTFKSANNVKIAILLVALFYLAFTPLSSWVHAVLADAGWDALLVEVLVMLSNFILEFLYCRFVVYRNSCDTAVSKKVKVENEEKAE